MLWRVSKITTKTNCERFFRAFVLSMVNTWLFLFSPYFRKFENGVLGSPIWSYFNEIILPKSRYLRRCKIDFLITERIICHIYQIYETEDESQCEAEEAGCEAQEAIEEEGCEKKVSRLKTRKEVRMMYSESILVGCNVR